MKASSFGSNANTPHGRWHQGVDATGFRNPMKMYQSKGEHDGDVNNNPVSNGLNPHESETLSRQVLRQMLRTKAKQDMQQQYGCVNQGLFVGYHSFPRRNRRGIQMSIAHRWYQQIKQEAKGDSSRGWLTGIMRKLFGAKENTLAAGAR